MGEEKLEGACLPLQEQLHDLGTAVHRWEKTGKTWIVGVFVVLWPYSEARWGC